MIIYTLRESCLSFAQARNVYEFLQDPIITQGEWMKIPVCAQKCQYA